MTGLCLFIHLSHKISDTALAGNAIRLWRIFFIWLALLTWIVNINYATSASQLSVQHRRKSNSDDYYLTAGKASVILFRCSQAPASSGYTRVEASVLKVLFSLYPQLSFCLHLFGFRFKSADVSELLCVTLEHFIQNNKHAGNNSTLSSHFSYSLIIVVKQQSLSAVQTC